jgi:hypothetical protein
MKRSDMVKLIALKLKLSGNHYCDDGRDLDDAESMLVVLEKYGMQPPGALIDHYPWTTSEWEPEND